MAISSHGCFAMFYLHLRDETEVRVKRSGISRFLMVRPRRFDLILMVIRSRLESSCCLKIEESGSLHQIHGRLSVAAICCSLLLFAGFTFTICVLLDQPFPEMKARLDIAT